MRKFILASIRLYQKFFSFDSGIFKVFSSSAPACRYEPSCSQYTYEAVSRYGTVKGLFLGLKRLLHCHPGFPGGFDPVK